VTQACQAFVHIGSVTVTVTKPSTVLAWTVFDYQDFGAAPEQDSAQATLSLNGASVSANAQYGAPFDAGTRVPVNTYFQDPQTGNAMVLQPGTYSMTFGSIGETGGTQQNCGSVRADVTYMLLPAA
jgi:hypothetical protein